MFRTSTPITVLALVAACGGRSDLAPAGSSESAAGGGGGSALAPSLQLVDGPFPIFPADFEIGAVKVVARSGGVDVLASRDGVPFGGMARHGKVAGAKPGLTWSGPAVEILPGVVSSVVATADGDTLQVCHHQFSGDPTSYSTFSGTYDRATGPTLLFGGSSCAGVAFRDGKGLLALHKLPPSGCCSRPEVFDIDGDGVLLSQGPELALPDGEFGDIRVTPYASGFAWAGPIGGAMSPGMHVRFRRPTGTLSHTVALDAQGQRPDIAAWPFEPAAAVSFPHGAGVRLVVVHESGDVLVDEAILGSPGHHVQRAPLGTSRHGLVTAYAHCTDDFATGPGELRLELRRDGLPTLETSIPVVCHAFVSTLAVVGDAVVVVFSSEDGLQGVVVKIVT